MSTIRVVNLQHTDATEPNIVLLEDGTSVFASGITISGGTNLTVSGTAEFASGTVSAPGVTFIDDNNTGLYSPAADTVAITTAATERVRVDNAGNVGIGTASPNSYTNYNTLTINDSAGSEVDFEVGGTLTGQLYAQSNLLSIDARGASTDLRFRTNITERMRIDSSGNVGIGTASPSAILHISKTVNSGDVGLIVQNTGTSSNTASIYLNKGSGAEPDHRIQNDTGGNLTFARGTNESSYTEQMRIDSSGNIGIGISSPAYKLHVSGVSGTTFALDSPNNYSSTASILMSQGRSEIKTTIDSSGGNPGGTLLFRTRNTSGSLVDAVTVTNLQRVGIGTSSPSAALHVSANDPAIYIQDANSTGNNVNATFQFRDSSNTQISYLGFAGTSDSNFSVFNTMSGGALRFGTASTERMRIDSSGRLLLNSGTDVRMEFGTNGTSGTNDRNWVRGSGTDLMFNCSNGGNLRWEIHGTEVMRHTGKLTSPGVYSGTTTGGGPVYVESDGDLLRFTSSLKYKTDVETLEDARADAILNCRPVWYRSKCANDIKTEGAEKSDWGWYGFIAEELAEIEPRLVNWATKDAVTQEDGKFKSVERDPADYEAEGVRYENFVPLLLNLIKRQQKAIETLKTEVAALKNN